MKGKLGHKGPPLVPAASTQAGCGDGATPRSPGGCICCRLPWRFPHCDCVHSPRCISGEMFTPLGLPGLMALGRVRPGQCHVFSLPANIFSFLLKLCLLHLLPDPSAQLCTGLLVSPPLNLKSFLPCSSGCLCLHSWSGDYFWTALVTSPHCVNPGVCFYTRS